MLFRLLTCADLASYLPRLVDVFPEADATRERAEEMLASGWRCIVADDGGELIGGAHWRPVEVEGVGWIAAMDFVWIDEGRRGRGLGARLVEHVLADIREVCPRALLAADTIAEGPEAERRWNFWRRFGAIDLGQVWVTYRTGARRERLAMFFLHDVPGRIRLAYLASLN